MVNSVGGDVELVDRRISGITFQADGSYGGLSSASEPLSVQMIFAHDPGNTRTITVDFGTVGDVDGGKQNQSWRHGREAYETRRDGTRRWLRTVSPQSLHPATQQRRSGVGGLLRVELRGHERSVLHGRDEPITAVRGPGHLRRAQHLVLGGHHPVAYPVGVHEVEPLTGHRGEQLRARRRSDRVPAHVWQRLGLQPWELVCERVDRVNRWIVRTGRELLGHAVEVQQYRQGVGRTAMTRAGSGPAVVEVTDRERR